MTETVEEARANGYRVGVVMGHARGMAGRRLLPIHETQVQPDMPLQYLNALLDIKLVAVPGTMSPRLWRVTMDKGTLILEDNLLPKDRLAALDKWRLDAGWRLLSPWVPQPAVTP